MSKVYISEKNIVYNYDRITFEYIGPSDASFDPEVSKIERRKKYTSPAFSTFTQPPKLKINEVAIYENDDIEWVIKPDFRGTLYYDTDGKEYFINKIGEEVPNEFKNISKPTDNLFKPKYENGKWIETALIFKGFEVKSKKDVDVITSNLIKNCGEEKAKTEKLICGNENCEVWNNFIKERQKIINEGNDFVSKYNLE
jgi:hypothetical protein